MNGCPPLSVRNGRVSYNSTAVGGRYPAYTVGTYSCNVSKRAGSGTRTCQRTGVWDGSPALCRQSEK